MQRQPQGAAHNLFYFENLTENRRKSYVEAVVCKCEVHKWVKMNKIFMFSHKHWPEPSITPSVQVSVSLQVFVMRLCWDVTDQRSIRLNIHVWSAAGMLQDSLLNIYGSFVIDQRSGCWIFKAETDRLIINNVTKWGGLADWSVSISTAIDEKLPWLKRTQGGTAELLRSPFSGCTTTWPPARPVHQSQSLLQRRGRSYTGQSCSTWR